MSGEHAIYEGSGRIRVITMNMPERMNAWNTFLMRDVSTAMERFYADDEATVVVLTGAGRGFCAGADRKESLEIMQLEDDDERAQRQAMWERERTRFMETVMRRDGPKPIVTAINGPAVGGGLGIALAGTFRVMAQSAFLQEVAMNIGAGLGGFIHSPLADHYGTLGEVENLPAAIENELLFGLRISAERAHQHGLVNRVVPLENLMDEATTMAEHIAGMDPDVVREICTNVRKQRRIRRPELVNNPRERNTGGAYDESRRKAALEFATRGRA